MILEDRRLLKGAATLLASALSAQAPVKAVQLVEFPSDFLTPRLRILVVVDETLAAQYRARLARPHMVPVANDPNAAHIGIDEFELPPALGEETRWEAAWSVLEVKGFSWVNLSDVDIVLVPPDWADRIQEFIGLHREADDGQTHPLFTEQEWQWAAANSQPFDPSTKQFVSRS